MRFFVDFKITRSFGTLDGAVFVRPDCYLLLMANLAKASVFTTHFSTIFQMSTTEKPQPPDPPDVGGGGGNGSPPGSSTPTQADASVSATVVDKKVPAKKKKVSFKFALETSDDVHIVKKEPIASFAPPVPIIKKECLTRAIRIALGGESIIMPSRLTGLTQKFRNNTANNIDKLNSLTFKSQVTATAASSSSSDTEDESNEDEVRACNRGNNPALSCYHYDLHHILPLFPRSQTMWRTMPKTTMATLCRRADERHGCPKMQRRRPNNRKTPAVRPEKRIRVNRESTN